MKILIKGGGILTDYIKPDIDAYTRQLDVPEGISVNQVLKYADIPEFMVAMMFVNGQLSQTDQKLYSGDTVTLRPPVQGG